MSMFACAAVFAEDPGHVEDDTLALALDCPMLEIRIQGSLTEIQPGWEECGACEKYLKLYLLFNRLISSVYLLLGFQRACSGPCQQGWLTDTAPSGRR